MQLRPHVQSVLRRASQILRTSGAFTRVLFHANATTRVHHDLWDATTVVLRTAIRQYVRDGHHVLELGTGHIGVLAVFCASIRHVQVTAVDINERFIENARKVAAASAAPQIRFHHSNWFSDVSGKFDIILSNLPYVPTRLGEGRPDATEFREVWDGGEDGLTHAKTILRDAPPFLTDSGRLLLGLNTVYVPRRATLAVLQQAPGLELEAIVTSRWSPGEVYVMRLKA